ncbi:LysR family transcriptional regulator [Shewanella sp. Scap07]|uniref:LysR substrate-binding domain-containing protein n=1 Tax=Shewanella sp. Scap07 TaxID=2589987 RepID=UPI0015BBE562|nr:LysR substrate-binding domain-containing protein [Shewanella sp. Scap07]QLE86266.1 LysR family transcriptional regulator [Shewanella sp. Scap07]
MSTHYSLAAIQTFTVVAQELSFSRAASLLNITPSAVSHQIKLLEQQLDVSLFHRKSHGVTLTVAGENLQKFATMGIQNIQHGVHQSQFASQRTRLVIAAIPSFCQRFLIPKLSHFQAQYPDIEIEVIALDKIVDFNTTQCDAHIHFGSGDYANLHSEWLAKESVYPVCHPALLSHQHIKNQKASHALLHNHTLLGYRAGIEDAPGGVSWPAWFSQFNIERASNQNQQWFSQVSLALTAAEHQQGIVLGWHHLLGTAMTDGKLVRIGNAQLDTQFQYYLVAPPAHWHKPELKAFHQWLKQQFAH